MYVCTFVGVDGAVFNDSMCDHIAIIPFSTLHDSSLKSDQINVIQCSAVCISVTYCAAPVNEYLQSLLTVYSQRIVPVHLSLLLEPKS